MEQGKMSRLTIAVLFCTFPCLAIAETIDVGSFNLESGGANISTLEQQIEGFDGIDIWGYSEVLAAWEDEASDASFVDEPGTEGHILGTTGGGDRLLIVYDDDRFTLVDSGELANINVGGNVRAPLWVRLRDSENNNLEFIFMVNHLYRSREDRRHQQATLLNQWAQNQTVPVIAVGDYNFDWDVPNGDNDHDDGYDNLTANDIFEWVRPAALRRTQCNLNFNSVLDFVFVAGDAQNWTNTSTIPEIRADYCTTNNTAESDHRPVFAFLNPAATTPPPNDPTGPFAISAATSTVAWVVDQPSGRIRRCELAQGTIQCSAWSQ